MSITLAFCLSGRLTRTHSTLSSGEAQQILTFLLVVGVGEQLLIDYFLVIEGLKKMEKLGPMAL